MCNNGNDNVSPVPSSSAIVPYSLKSLQAAVAAAVTANDPSSTAAAAYMTASIHHSPQLTQAALDHYRMQLYSYVSYADRLRYAHHHQHHPANSSLTLGHPHPYSGPHALVPLPSSAGHAVADVYALGSPYAKFDPCRAYRLHQEEPKPQHSYIGLIGMAILSAPDKKLVLSDIYQHILDNYSYFRNRGPGWRNSIRHNLSLNDCFVKAGRSANGKGHFWAIHPANLEDFKKGDFRRRKAQRRVRKHLGLSIPEDDDSISPPPPPSATVTSPSHATGAQQQQLEQQNVQQSWPEKPDSTTSGGYTKIQPFPVTKKRRQFDMDSILAPERRSYCSCNGEHPGKIIFCNDVRCSRGVFENVFKTETLNTLPSKASASSTWLESNDDRVDRQQSLLVRKERDDDDEEDEEGLTGRKDDQLMIDECSSSSLLTEATPNWTLPVVGEPDDDIDSDSKSNSRSSSSCSDASRCAVKAPTAQKDVLTPVKGVSLIKGPIVYSSNLQTPPDPEQFSTKRNPAFQSTRSVAIVVSNHNKRCFSPPTSEGQVAGPLALTSTGRPNTHSNLVSVSLSSDVNKT